MNLDLLLIHPGAAHGIYGELGDQLTALEPPLWCRLIAGYVRDRGFSVKIIDAEADRMGPHEVGEAVRDARPTLACLAVYGHQPSASTQQMVGASAIAKAIKAQSHTDIIMVGGHVSALPERTLREEAVDYVAIGEGPCTIVDLLRYYRGLGPETVGLKAANDIAPQTPRLENIAGLAWRVRGTPQTIHMNPSAPLIENLDELHGRAWDLLPMSRYRAHNWQCLDGSPRQPYASVYTSLGCPYRCSFCCINAPFASNRYRMRRPIDVVEEIAMLREDHGVRTFKIVDEMFVLNPKHYTEIAERLAALPYASELNIWAYARVDTVRPDTLALLRRAGFRWLALGIESGSKHVRDGAKKALKNEDIVGTVRSIEAAGINVIANYIFGLPDDDSYSMRETFALARRLNTAFANFYCAMAYPGSALYDQANREGWTLPATWRGYSQHNDECRPLDTAKLSAAQVLRFRDGAFLAYFQRPSYQEMIAQKFGLDAVAEIVKMTGYKLKRNLLEEAA